MDLVRIAEQDQVGDAAQGQDLGGTQDALVGPFRQHDMLAWDLAR